MEGQQLKILALCFMFQSMLFQSSSSFVVPIREVRHVSRRILSSESSSCLNASPLDSLLDAFRYPGTRKRRANNNNNGYPDRLRPKTVNRGYNSNRARTRARTRTGGGGGLPGLDAPKPWDSFQNPFSSDNNDRQPRKPVLARPRSTNRSSGRQTLQRNIDSLSRPIPPPITSRQQSINLSEKARTIFNYVPSVRVQGTVQKTWSFTTGEINRVHVMMKTDGRPLSANVELWRGPDNTPQKMAVYIEDGSVRPFNAIVETPGSQNVVSICNTNSLEFPLNAILEAELDDVNIGLEEATQWLEYSNTPPRLVQGGSVYTKAFDYNVASVQIQLKTDGRPLSARIELLQGPNNGKQIMDVYTENGLDYPFFIVVETPGSENLFRVVNTATVEYPLYAALQPYEQTTPEDNMNRLYPDDSYPERLFEVERII